MKTKKNALLIAAVAGLVAGFTSPIAFADEVVPSPTQVTKDSCSGKAGCEGTTKEEKASCKGEEKAGCKGEKAGCNGK